MRFTSDGFLFFPKSGVDLDIFPVIPGIIFCESVNFPLCPEDFGGGAYTADTGSTEKYRKKNRKYITQDINQKTNTNQK